MLPAWPKLQCYSFFVSLALMLFTRGWTGRYGGSVPVGRRKMCFTLQTWIFYSTYNLTHLGRDTFIYGLLINQQSLSGLLCEFLSVQTAHITKQTIKSICKMSPFLKTTGHSFERRAFEFHSWNQKLAENYLNSYFNILQRESGGWVCSGTRTNKSITTKALREGQQGTRLFASHAL